MPICTSMQMQCIDIYIYIYAFEYLYSNCGQYIHGHVYCGQVVTKLGPWPIT